MIDKTYINFYYNWYYKKIGDEYQAKEVGKNNVGVISEITKCPICEFIKQLVKFGAREKSYDFLETGMAVICEKYPYIKDYHREILISKIKRPPVISLFITAIKKNDYTLCNFIIDKYNLTEDDVKSWVLKTITEYDCVKVDEVKYGETYFYLKNNSDMFSQTITYKKGDIYTIKNNVRYVLSAELIKQLDEATDTFNQHLNEVFAETNGYHVADFGDNRFIGYKQIKPAFYHFIVISKYDDECLTHIHQTFCNVQTFLGECWWHYGLLRESPRPLYLSAKKCGDKFLEYEIKFFNFAASQSEIDYLNENDPETATQTDETRKRYYLQKEIYDIDDIEILNVSTRVMQWYRRLYECEIVIDNKKVIARFWDKNELIISTRYKNLTCKITPKLAEDLRQRFAQII